MLPNQTREAVCYHVARILREERLKRKLSLNEVAARSGLSHQMVGYVERELRNPTLDSLLRITAAIGIDLPGVVKRAAQAAAKQRPR